MSPRRSRRTLHFAQRRPRPPLLGWHKYPGPATQRRNEDQPRSQRNRPELDDARRIVPTLRSRRHRLLRRNPPMLPRLRLLRFLDRSHNLMGQRLRNHVNHSLSAHRHEPGGDKIHGLGCANVSQMLASPVNHAHLSGADTLGNVHRLWVWVGIYRRGSRKVPEAPFSAFAGRPGGCTLFSPTYSENRCRCGGVWIGVQSACLCHLQSTRTPAICQEQIFTTVFRHSSGGTMYDPRD